MRLVQLNADSARSAAHCGPCWRACPGQPVSITCSQQTRRDAAALAAYKDMRTAVSGTCYVQCMLLAGGYVPPPPRVFSKRVPGSDAFLSQPHLTTAMLCSWPSTPTCARRATWGRGRATRRAGGASRAVMLRPPTASRPSRRRPPATRRLLARGCRPTPRPWAQTLSMPRTPARRRPRPRCRLWALCCSGPLPARQRRRGYTAGPEMEEGWGQGRPPAGPPRRAWRTSRCARERQSHASLASTHTFLFAQHLPDSAGSVLNVTNTPQVC